MSDKKPLGFGVSLSITTDRKKLIETLPAILDDLSYLHSIATDPESKKVIKEVHGKIADLIVIE